MKRIIQIIDGILTSISSSFDSNSETIKLLPSITFVIETNNLPLTIL